MKLFLCNLFIFFSLSAYSQLIDNFSDGDFSANPTWNGSTSKFKINTSKQLQLNDTVASGATLYTDLNLISLDSIEWSFYIKLSFSPSSNNYARIYLSSDQSDLTLPLNGYFLQLGESGSNDAIELFKQTGTSLTSIARGSNGSISASFAKFIKITHHKNGTWKLYSGTNLSSAILEATGVDSMINSSNYFGLNYNYTISNATKFYFDELYIGTIIRDTTPPILIKSTVVNSKEIDLDFSEKIDSLSAIQVSNYTINNNVGSPLSATIDSTNNNRVHLTFSNELPNGKECSLTISEISDLESNTSYAISTSILYYRPNKNDLLINEILYDPKTGGTDFIEIYNVSDKIVDLNKITICSFDTITQVITSAYPLVDTNYLIYPNYFKVLTENIELVLSHYKTTNKDAFLQLNNIPSMNITGGGIAIMSISNDTVDKLKYNPNMHFPLLTETKGVSLERINYFLPTQLSSNWHSAAESVGFATPGYQNSQYLIQEYDNTITITPELFSPDNDGYNDVTSINYNLNKVGFVANINIYNSSGVLIKELIKNEPLATQGSFLWNGLTDNNEKAIIGIYVISIELYNTEGELRHYKKACTIGGKL